MTTMDLFTSLPFNVNTLKAFVFLQKFFYYIQNGNMEAANRFQNAINLKSSGMYRASEKIKISLLIKDVMYVKSMLKMHDKQIAHDCYNFLHSTINNGNSSSSQLLLIFKRSNLASFL